MADSRYSDCKELFAALSQYLDRELPAEDCRAIQAHIAQCPPCVEFVNSLKKTVELCRQAGAPAEPPPPMPDELRRKLLAAFNSARPHSA
jgi:anti-sigma factor (TIGR02949 family)